MVTWQALTQATTLFTIGIHTSPREEKQPTVACAEVSLLELEDGLELVSWLFSCSQDWSAEMTGASFAFPVVDGEAAVREDVSSGGNAHTMTAWSPTRLVTRGNIRLPVLKEWV